MTIRSTYQGSRPMLVIAIDVGTTFSGAAYTILRAGKPPEVYNVNGYKGQENKEGNSKVPSVLFYSPSGELLACGSEVRKLRHKKGIKTEWFKLGLRPPSMAIKAPQVEMPYDRDVIGVFGDFLKYMYECVRTHIIDTHIDGWSVWSSMSGTAHLVLSHPNGWGAYQQGKMREAAIRGGLIPDTPEGRERIEFVTEGEASFHWCIDKGLAGTSLQEGTRIVVADLGGGTIDVSSFIVTTRSPLRLKEQMAPDCALEGSIIVSKRFADYERRKLRGTPYGGNDYIESLREEFDQEAKCHFDGLEAETTVRIGGRKEEFTSESENGLGEIDIEGGYLHVERHEMVAAFDPSLDATVDAIRKHVAGNRTTHVFLVGGFAASPWVFSETKRRLKAAGLGCEVKRAQSDTAKAVAHGGVVFYLDRNVTERTMRFTCGIGISPSYNSSNAEHEARKHKLWKDEIEGRMYVGGGFSTLVKKDQVVSVDSVYRQSGIHSKATRAPETITWYQSIQRYSGTRSSINFIDMDASAFDDIGSFRCEIPASAMKRYVNDSGLLSFMFGGTPYYEAEYDVVITLGAVEMKAYVEWEENGTKKRTPASSIWKDYY